MQPLQFEYTTSAKFAEHFPYWPNYELTMRYTTDGDTITITGAEIDTGTCQCCAAHTLFQEMAVFYRAPLLENARDKLQTLTEAKPCTDTI